MQLIARLEPCCAGASSTSSATSSCPDVIVTRIGRTNIKFRVQLNPDDAAPARIGIYAGALKSHKGEGSQARAVAGGALVHQE